MSGGSKRCRRPTPLFAGLLDPSHETILSLEQRLLDQRPVDGGEGARCGALELLSRGFKRTRDPLVDSRFLRSVAGSLT